MTSARKALLFIGLALLLAALLLGIEQKLFSWWKGPSPWIVSAMLVSFGLFFVVGSFINTR